MSFLEDWELRKGRESKEDAKRIEKHEQKASEDMKEILAYLERKGIKEVKTNKYWYEFSYKGKDVHFVNQEIRICGQAHRPLISEAERNCVNEFVFFSGLDKSRFIDEFEYINFTINGNPIYGVSRVLSLIDEKVARRIK